MEPSHWTLSLALMEQLPKLKSVMAEASLKGSEAVGNLMQHTHQTAAHDGMQPSGQFKGPELNSSGVKGDGRGRETIWRSEERVGVRWGTAGAKA